ncbi:MAG: tetratricopeptide repeat protein [Campylobacterota bacterium]|nr:tetratricopeptide repeat protein [Campylobacterota bacterium]
MKKIVGVFLYIFLINTVAFAKESSDESYVDHLALATLMVYDANYDVAREELALVDKSAKKFNGAKFYTISGVIDTKQKKYKNSIINFKKAIVATQKTEYKAPVVKVKEKYLFSFASEKEVKVVDNKPVLEWEKNKKEKIEKLYIYLSQSYYKIKDYKNTVKALNNAGTMGKNRSSLYTLRAECYWKIKEHSHSFNALNEGIKLFPKATKLLKQKFYYLAELKLYQASIKIAKQYIKASGNSSSEHIALAQLLLQANQLDEAIKILEVAKLTFPKEAKIDVILSHAYGKKGMKFTSAEIFEIASIYDKKYETDSVEMHRRVGNIAHAIYLNSKMKDKVQKLKHKIAIYISREEYEKVVGLISGLKRYNLLKDDNVRYALAYSYYMEKDYKNAEKQLKKISDNELFAKATVIRKNIEKCRNDSMECI